MGSNDKRERILQAAEEVFGAKGLAGASIAEIARKAEVTDSVIYQYFNSKEDLLFSIPGSRMPEITKYIESGLEGLIDPVSLLRRIIWLHLRYEEDHPGYARLLLLECRTNPNFYRSGAYAAIRKYAGIMLRILEGGVQDGVFSDQVDMRLIRDMIFGTLDYEAIGCHISGETKQTGSDLDSIMGLVLAMISKREAPGGGIDRAASISVAAEKVFAERGFSGARISDVAAAAGIAEGTIYDYFRSKEDLLLSVAERRFHEAVEEFSGRHKKKTPVAMLRRLVRNHYFTYMRNRDFFEVFVLQIQLNVAFYRSSFYKTFQGYLSLIEKIIDEGKSEGSFRQDVDPRVFRNMFLGTFTHMAFRSFAARNALYTAMLSEIDDVINLLCTAVMTDQAMDQLNLVSSRAAQVFRGTECRTKLSAKP